LVSSIHNIQNLPSLQGVLIICTKTCVLLKYSWYSTVFSS